MKSLRRWKTFTSRACLVVFSIFLAVAVGEAALRFLGYEPGYIPRYNLGLAKVDKVELIESRYATDQEGVWCANPAYNWDEGKINSEGFRSIEFEPDNSEKPSILFLGDSFTWGVSAWPESNSFVDLVAAKGYMAYNTGIPGADPHQYAYLAEKYVPRLKPDFVAVMFFMGNDFVPPKPMLPNKNLHHITNAGWMYAFDNQGNFMETPEQAHAYWKSHSNWLEATDRADLPDNAVRRLMLKTVVGSYGWFHASPWLVRIGQRLGHEYPVIPGVWNKPGEHTLISLRRIQTVCQEHGAEFMLFLIPVDPVLENENNSITKNLSFFDGFSPMIPDFLQPSNYDKASCHHLNNDGHWFFSRYILKVLKEAGGKAG